MKNFQERAQSMIGMAKCNINSQAFAGRDMTDDLAIINIMATKPMKIEDIFCFEFELSNNNVDAYFTRMTLGSLTNYADRINSVGVPLMANHVDEAFPIGRIYSGEVTKNEDGMKCSLMCRAYIVRGDENSCGVSADAIIGKIETGVQKDTSIGFIPGGYTCSICGSAMVPGWSARAVGVECDHVCGGVYDGQTCYAWVDDGMILEGSLVYTGATPEAIISKALNMFKSNKLSAKQLNSVNHALNTHLTIENIKTENAEMKAKELLEKVSNGLSDELKNQIADASKTVNEDDDADKAIEVLQNGFKKLETETNDLKIKAELGNKFVAATIEDTLDEGVRAMGNDFDKEAMREVLTNASIETMNKIKAGFSATIANVTKRQTTTDVTPIEGEKRPDATEVANGTVDVAKTVTSDDKSVAGDAVVGVNTYK